MSQQSEAGREHVGKTADCHHIIVVGAGIGGLATAYYAKQAGFRVTVFEAGDRPGGRIMRLTHGGDVVDSGAQGIHTNYRDVLSLVSEVGLEDELRISGGLIQHIFPDNIRRIVRGKFDLFLKLSLASQIRMSFAFAALKLMWPFISFFSIDHARPWLDNRTVADFFGHANKDLMNLIVRPLCFAMANATPDRISFLHFANVFNLVNATQVYKIVSGIASLPERLALQLDIRYNCPAESLVVYDGRVTGIQLQNGETCMADHVVIATSAGAAGNIVPPSLGALKRSLSDFPHTPLILAFFFLNRPTGLDAASYFNFEDDDIIFRMAIDHAKRVPDMVPSGNAVISAWTAYPESQHLLSLSDSEIEGRALQDLEHVIPGISTWVHRAEIVRHEWGVSHYVPGLRARILDLKTEVSNIPGLSLIGADYNSVHLESAIRSARHTVSQFCREMVAE